MKGLEAKAIEGANAFGREVSETAATVGKPLYGPSGVMKYLVILGMQGGARTSTTVEASTGDEAATEALKTHPGWRVAYVGPATQHDASPRLPDDEAA
jgi:hypothetical protein